ncbi:Crp/Fnr family transcriptional regulator [Phreatobacter sp.]|uniref:Crp/Fnr family transcriptional regulator n=1 Tax=Phreatobacter sp. TaxID=1966341 RepID=UPI003F6F019A
MTMRAVAAGDVIYDHDVPVTHTVFPLSGVLSFLALRTDGRTIEKGNVGPEGFVGVATMLERHTMHGRCIASIAGQTVWLPATIFDEAMERFTCMRLMLLRYSRARIEQLHELLVCYALHTADRRIVRWLLEAFDKAGNPSIELKQESLAELLGLRRATVSGVCHDLLAGGIIRYSRGHMELVNRPRMEAAACPCYAHIRSRFRYQPLCDRA